jgi:hypothetical protein
VSLVLVFGIAYLDCNSKFILNLPQRLQGRNADALALYFGEDPARCPFEQGALAHRLS